MLLALSIVALLAGPLVYTLGRRNAVARQFLDGFIFITIAGSWPSASRSPSYWNVACMIPSTLRTASCSVSRLSDS